MVNIKCYLIRNNYHDKQKISMKFKLFVENPRGREVCCAPQVQIYCHRVYVIIYLRPDLKTNVRYIIRKYSGNVLVAIALFSYVGCDWQFLFT